MSGDAAEVKEEEKTLVRIGYRACGRCIRSKWHGVGVQTHAGQHVCGRKLPILHGDPSKGETVKLKVNITSFALPCLPPRPPFCAEVSL